MIVRYNEAYVQADNENMSRRILAHNKDLMLAEVVFHKKSDDPGLHKHPHKQIAYVTKGKFEFVTEGKGNAVLGAGDSIYFEPDVVHGGKVLEDDSRLLDIFTPQRDEFLEKQVT